MDNKQIKFDPTDLGSMISLMNEYGNSTSMYPGTNDDGEEVFISIYHERIVVSTMQSNGWNRVNTYYRDGSRDETFDGKWK